MRQTICALTLVLLSLALAACSAGALNQSLIAISVLISPDVPAVGPADVTVYLRDPGGMPIRGAAVAVEASTLHPRVTPIKAWAGEIAPGSYRVRVDWPAAGDWFVVVHATLRDGQVIDRQVNIPYVRP